MLLSIIIAFPAIISSLKLARALFAVKLIKLRNLLRNALFFFNFLFKIFVNLGRNAGFFTKHY